MGGYSPSAPRLRALLFNYFAGREDVFIASRVGTYVKDANRKVAVYPQWLTETIGKSDVELSIVREVANEWHGPWRWALHFPSVVFWNEDLYKEALNGHEHLFVQIRNAELAEGLRRYIMQTLAADPVRWPGSEERILKGVYYTWNTSYCFRKNFRQHAYPIDYERYTEDHFRSKLTLREFLFRPNTKYFSDRAVVTGFEEFNDFLIGIGCADFLAEGFEKINSQGLGSVCDLTPLLEATPVKKTKSKIITEEELNNM